ncbi:ubiquitin-conjugating enzyme E2 34-like [Impatiens glandulifera]|uniref:ubiquitin-conjugating enzyme E2 34-like n=1 Tax=Impatiens glandulifera TaxID=253017 RepID=UPI001FB1123B|nr:ubiquitin-conjugating enzyme E2 34-like [Impatiens glandulifera]XP_047328858.1 ubiquitin-conjugating enzyme E2 34-like [Impatiens glandulifera]
MAEKACVKRLQKEYRSLCKEPVSHVTARPSPTDILEWHYVLEGSEGTPFSGGYYYGKIKFPPDYPYKPPGITMITPNGRFMTQKKICLSMSDFHPESWNPMWSVSSILTGLLSFMMDTSPTTGSVTTTDIEKQRLAKSSLAFNCKNPTFRKIFPEYMEKHEKLSNQSTNNDDELSPRLPNKENSQNPSLLEKRARNQEEKQGRNEEEDEEGVNNNKNPRRRQQEERRKKQSVPTWVLVLLFSVFGIVMALPLLQL